MNTKELLDKAVELQGERTALEKKNKALQAKVKKLEEQLTLTDVVVLKCTLKTNKGKCPCKMPFSQTWCEKHERWT